jgi:hypothetical protein
LEPDLVEFFLSDVAAVLEAETKWGERRPRVCG